MFFCGNDRRKIGLHRRSLIYIFFGSLGLQLLYVRWLRIWLRAQPIALTGEPCGRTVRLNGSLCGKLRLGRLLVTFPHTFVALTLREVDHPVAAFAWLRDRPLHL